MVELLCYRREIMRIKELRKENRKTQTEMAKYLNIAQNSYQRYEAGETEPNIGNLIKLADYYNVSIDYLVGRERHNDIGYLKPEIRSLLELCLQLSEDNLTKTIGYVTALVSIQ